MLLFEEKEPTLEELAYDLKISKKSYEKLIELSMLDNLNLLLKKDNDISLCQSDLKNVFDGKDIIGYIGWKEENISINVFDATKEVKDIIIFLQDKEYKESMINEIIDTIKNEKNFNINYVFGFKKSSNKKIWGLIVG